MTAARHNRPSNLSGLWGKHCGEPQDTELIVESANGRVWSDGVQVKGGRWSGVVCDWLIKVNEVKRSRKWCAVWQNGSRYACRMTVSERDLFPQTSCRDYSHSVRHGLHGHFMMNVLQTRILHTFPHSSMPCKSLWWIEIVNLDLLKEWSWKRREGKEHL